MIDLDADIVPGKGLGGLSIGTKALDVQDTLFSDVMTREFVSSVDLRYHLGKEGEVEAGFDLRTGQITRLTARQGYRGRLLGKITVGMTWEDAVAADTRIMREGDDWAVVQGVPGVRIELRTVAGFQAKTVIDGIVVAP